MATPSQPRHPLSSPRARLIYLFLCWKAVLLLIAFSSPGYGYDTSTSLFLGDAAQPAIADKVTSSRERSWLWPCVAKLLRWDAIYLIALSRRGYLFEQDWAFGSVFPKAVALFSTGTHCTAQAAAHLEQG